MSYPCTVDETDAFYAKFEIINCNRDCFGTAASVFC